MLCTKGPGYFLEVEKMLPLLTASSPDHPSFHVVAPSLPGFGFSDAPNKPGFAGPQYAEVRISLSTTHTAVRTSFQVFNKLMLSLGYDEYGESHRGSLYSQDEVSTHLKCTKVATGDTL